MRNILYIKSTIPFIMISLWLLACNSGDPVAIINLEEAAQREFGSIPVSAETELRIYNSRGGIIVDGTGDSATLDYMIYKLVHAEEKQTAQNNLHNISLTNYEQSDTLNISITAPENSQSLKYFCGLSLTAFYATNCHIADVAGDVNISDLYANVNILNARDHINVSRHTGSCDVFTQNGDIRISVIIPDSGYCVAETIDGDIDLYIPAQTSAQLTAQTSKGSIYFADISFSQLTEGPDGISGIIGAGAGRINLITGKGDVRIYGF